MRWMGSIGGSHFYSSVSEALERVPQTPSHCVVGVATVGGGLPAALREDLLIAASAGLTLVNGLHQLLSEDAELLKRASGGILDLRKPRPASELRFWTGEILSIPAPRIAVLGMDCAIGKRTTAMALRTAFSGAWSECRTDLYGANGLASGVGVRVYL